MQRQTLIEQIQEMRLRKAIRSIINKKLLESKSTTKISDGSLHPQTGINVLETVLKKIIPSLEDAYKSLTTDKAQRLSFRVHILNAVKNALLPEEINYNAGGSSEEELSEGLMLDEVGDLDGINLELKPEKYKDPSKFIPVRDADKPKEETDEDRIKKFTLKGTDETGRNFAIDAFKQVGQQIIKAYETLSNPSDKNTFFEYLLTNLKLYFDKFEEEISGASLKEPESPNYQPVQ